MTDVDDMIGHNGPPDEDNTTSVAGEELKQLIERIERLEEDKKVIADDIKEVYAEAKGRGFDSGGIRRVIKLRKKSEQEREEERAITELYLQALGML